MNPFAWTVDNLSAPGYSAALLPLADGLTGLPRVQYDMGKAPATESAQDEPVQSSNAAGVSRSWTNESVKAARMHRDNVRVTVNGRESEHKSLRDAFRAYRLPDSKHIRFRQKLKASRVEMFEWDGTPYLFTLIPQKEGGLLR